VPAHVEPAATVLQISDRHPDMGRRHPIENPDVNYAKLAESMLWASPPITTLPNRPVLKRASKSSRAASRAGRRRFAAAFEGM